MHLLRSGVGRPLGLGLRIQARPMWAAAAGARVRRASGAQPGLLGSAAACQSLFRSAVPGRALRGLFTSRHLRSSAPPPPSPEPHTHHAQPARKKIITQAVATLHATKHGDQGPALSEDILTIPNALTASRLLMVPVIGWMVVHGHMLPAAGLLFAAGVTDVLDGWIARRTGRLTVFGSVADPAADKGLMATMVICLGVSGLLPLPLVALILARDVGLILSAFVIRYRTLPPPKTVARYFDPSLPSVMAKPTQLSKYNTFLQLLLVGLATILPAIPEASAAASAAGIEAHPMLASLGSWLTAAFVPFQWIVASTTALSGLQYLTGAGVRRVAAGAVKQPPKGTQGPTSLTSKSSTNQTKKASAPDT